MSNLLISKRWLVLGLLAALSMAITACVTTGPLPAVQETPEQPAAAGEVVTLFVGPNQVPCTGVMVQTCYLVKDTPDGEYKLFYDQIQGFEFEPGYEYELRVNKETIPNPPADASRFRWTLVEQVSKTAVAPAAPLEGTLWQLIALANAQGQLVMPVPETKVTITFADGKISGNGGCNNYFGSYTVDGNALSVQLGGSTMMACSEPIMAQEAAYFAALGTASTYLIAGNQLQIADANGQTVLAFTPLVPTPLTGTTWQALSYNNGKQAVVSVLGGTEITAVFGDDGNLSGSAGCNRYTAGYTVDGDSIAIGPAASTRMFCGEPEGVMEQETAYLMALSMAEVYAIQGDKLELRTADGALVASFVAVPEVAVAPAEIDADTMNALMNLSYNGTAIVTPTVQLTDGVYTAAEPYASVTFITGTVAAGELNGQPAYAVVLVSSGGGSGVFYDLAVVTEQDGQLTNAATTLLGDRVDVRSLTIENNQIVVDMVTQGPDEPMCCGTLEVQIVYELQGDQLVPVSYTELGTISASGTTTSTEASIVGVSWEWVESVYSDGNITTVADPTRYTLELLPDGTAAIGADCNRVVGSYTLDGSSLNVVLGPSTMAACPPDSQADLFLRDLAGSASYVMDGADLVINLMMDAGNMRFRSASAAAAPAAPASLSPEAVTLDASPVAESVAWQTVPATPYDASMPPGPTGAPEHLLGTFDGEDYYAQDFTGRVAYIIPVAAYEALWNEAGNDSITRTVESLKALLTEQPAAPTAPLPVLPPIYAVNDLATQVAYLSLPGADATGIRWVGRFSQDASPVFNYQLRYVFQGLTNDGQYLIALDFPVTTAALPDDPAALTAEEMQAIEQDFTAYLQATADMLNSLAPSDFAPDLTALDAMMQSLTFTTPAPAAAAPAAPAPAAPPPPSTSPITVPTLEELVGAVWQWEGTTTPVEQITPDNPANYLVALLPGGLVRGKADCNQIRGTYAIDENAITLNVAAATRMACPAGSLSEEFIRQLSAARLFFTQDGDLYFDLLADSGTMRFAQRVAGQ